MRRFSFNPWAFVRRLLLKVPMTPIRPYPYLLKPRPSGTPLGSCPVHTLHPQARELKIVNHTKDVRRCNCPWCNCIGCYNLQKCHGLCKEHRDEKRRLGYRC